MKAIIKATAALLALLVYVTPLHAWSSFNEANGTLSVQNIDCGDFDFHIYGNNTKCTIKNDYEIKNGTTSSFSVLDTWTENRQDAYDRSYTKDMECEYAVEAVGEILGGYNYSAGDTAVCKMKSSSIVFKSCRCN